MSYSNLEEFMDDFMEYIRGAIENTDETLLSYSKCLTVALFKWSNLYSSCLLIHKLHTNTINMIFDVSCFDWYETYDDEGNTNNRYHGEQYESTIPLRELLHREKLLSEIYSDLADKTGEMYHTMDIDNIEFEINGMTMDVSNIGRNSLNTYFNDSIYRYASYRKDMEILTTEKGFSYCIKDKKVLQLIKYIYLMKIGNAYTEKVDSLVADICLGKYKDIIEICQDEQEAFEWVLGYLSNISNIKMERNKYFEIYPYDSQYYFEYWYPEGVHKLLRSLCEGNNNLFFEAEFLKWLQERA